MDTGEIYVITNITNYKQYVGQAVSYSSGKKHGTKMRWKQHITRAFHGDQDCPVLNRAICKYGQDNFVIDVVLICPLAEIDDNEKLYIEMYNTRAPNGYNLRAGGNNGGLHHPSTIKKIGDSNRGLVVDQHGRANIGKASKYRNMSEENQIRLRDALNKLQLDDLPMYIVLSVDRRCNRNVDVIQVRVPNKPTRKFGQKSMALSEKIRLAIEYKNSLT